MPLSDITDLKVLVFQIATGSVAIYNCIELIIKILHRFKRYDTLYFWSLIIATLGTFLFVAGFLPLFAHDGSLIGELITLTIGWHSMVTGFSVIMYSRLHVINCAPFVIRLCRYMIIFNYIFSHLPTTVLTFGANLVKTPAWIDAYAIEEKIQMTLFCAQETILSLIYLYYTRRMIYPGVSKSRKSNDVIIHTIYINLIVLLLDLVALAVEYANLYDYQIMFKALLYSLKIKFEFSILDLLTDLFNKPGGGDSSAERKEPNSSEKKGSQKRKGSDMYQESKGQSLNKNGLIATAIAEV